jgi:hypothetical protein
MIQTIELIGLVLAVGALSGLTLAGATGPRVP